MRQRGFTLIELVVVMAVIGLLSSVIVTTLTDARLKARDSSIKSSVLQLRTIMQQEFSDTGSYESIKAGGDWFAVGQNCDARPFSGAYAQRAREVCNSILNSLPGGAACGANCIYFRYTNPNANDQFTIMAYLPGASASAGSAQYLCYGNSGRSSVGPAGSWTGAGCYANP